MKCTKNQHHPHYYCTFQSYVHSEDEGSNKCCSTLKFNLQVQKFTSLVCDWWISIHFVHCHWNYD